MVEFKEQLLKTLRISWSLARVNFSLRIEGSYLGVFWYLLGPLATFFVILFIKKSAFSGVIIDNYPAYLLIGLVGLHFFQQAITYSIDSIKNNAGYIKSISHLPLESLVLSAVLQAAFSHLFEIGAAIILLIILQVPLVNLIFYPLVFFVFFILTLGLGFLTATIGVYIRDLNNLWSIFSQLLLFFTPIIYFAAPGTLVYLANLANPLFYFLEIARSFIVYEEFSAEPLVLPFIIFSLIMFIFGWLVFNKYKKGFAQRL